MRRGIQILRDIEEVREEAMERHLCTSIPWDDLAGTSGEGIGRFVVSITKRERWNHPAVRRCTSMLLDRADQDGESRACQLHAGAWGKVVFPNPILNLILQSNLPMLQRYMDRGFDPHARIGNEDGVLISAIEAARLLSMREIADFMTSSFARMSVDAILLAAATQRQQTAGP